MPSRSTPDPDRVLELVLGFWISRGVMAAVELGVFDLLARGPMTLGAAAGALRLAERPARALLDTCVSVGLLARDRDGYRTTAEARAFLTEESEYSLRNYVLDESWCWGAWGRLVDALRADAPTMPADAHGYHTFPEEFFLDFLHGHTLAMAERLADAVDLSGVRRLLDVGGGSGAASIALCRRHPSLAAVVVDQEPVVTKAADHVARAGLADRIATRATNLFTDPLPTGCDAALLANVLHDFAPDAARAILRRVRDALERGARLLIMEIAPDDERAAPPLAVAFALTMVVNTAGGAAHTVADYREMLSAEGFALERVVPLGGRIVTTAIEARAR